MLKKLNRRDFVKIVGAVAFSPGSILSSQVKPAAAGSSGVLVNDVHSQLNPTRVKKVLQASSSSALKNAIEMARKQKTSVSICGGRHAGGGQQFASDSLLVDTARFNKVINFDREKGLIEVQSGIMWPELLKELNSLQKGAANPWNIKQKQTGGDRISIGGTLSANAHGQGLIFQPFISDVESFTVFDASGNLQNCSRTENAELFKLAIGGYGLFGLFNSVTLRLVPRRKLERIVELLPVSDLQKNVAACIEKGYSYGDYKINIDSSSPGYLRDGFFCSYRPADPDKPVAVNDFRDDAWFNFALGAHLDMHTTYEKFYEFCKASSGLVNWADEWQMGPYIPDYHRLIDNKMHAAVDATEVLSEIYVPRSKLAEFAEDVRADFLKNNVKLIFSVIRFIDKDTESFLPWAKQSYACMILNLHTIHSPAGIDHTAETLRRLIDIAIKYNGSYYLTYTKFPLRNQLLACYPQFEEFLKLKLKYDPSEIFQSDWYRHYKKMF